MIKFKDGVKIDGVTKECISGMSVASEYFSMYLDRDLVITSVSDGVHGRNSKHYEGDAFDMRTWTTDVSGVQMDVEEKGSIACALSSRLGFDYDVVAEGDHIHIEYDPK